MRITFSRFFTKMFKRIGRSISKIKIREGSQDIEKFRWMVDRCKFPVVEIKENEVRRWTNE